MSYGTAETFFTAEELVLSEIAHRGVGLAESVRLQAMARVRIAVGAVLVGLGIMTLVGGSFEAAAIAWAAFFLVLAALQFSVGYWYLAIIRSPSARA